jgi:hypothetical protein
MRTDISETAQIIQFADAARPKRRPVANHTSSVAKNEEGVSETAMNGKLREERKEIWRMAEAATRYWRLRLDFEDAVSFAQRLEIPEGSYHPVVNQAEDRMPMVRRWREALVKQLLTPAPDTRSVTWKQAVPASRQFRNTGVKSERIERAIADDVEFLKAHPTRRRDLEQ